MLPTIHDLVVVALFTPLTLLLPPFRTNPTGLSPAGRAVRRVTSGLRDQR